MKDPLKKMSKSDESSKSRIEITDSPDIVVKKIKEALTDMKSQVTYDPKNRPAVSNLIDIHSISTGSSPAKICEDAKHLNTGE